MFDTLHTKARWLIYEVMIGVCIGCAIGSFLGSRPVEFIEACAAGAFVACNKRASWKRLNQRSHAA